MFCFQIMADLQLNYNLKNTLQNKITVKTAYNLGLTRLKDVTIQVGGQFKSKKPYKIEILDCI